jgi:Zn finger protein HypA/HybF involved in hydrogenase expression
MLYDISPQDFAHHVRHATSWQDLGVRCGLEKNKRGVVRNHDKLSMLQQKVHNMRLNVDHFRGHQLAISDDDFKTIVKESTSINQVMMKCKLENGGKIDDKVIKRISDLCLDISHFTTRKKYTISGGPLDAIDDETFKMLVNNNRTWKNLGIACGYSNGASQKIASRIEKLGLNTKHYDDRDVIPTDKIFVLDSQYTDSREIKKRLIRVFDRVYECAACNNQNFIKCDGVLIWNKKEIVLQLEHKNGINDDNRLENLEFLCPNCHSQTHTFSGGNVKKRKVMLAWIEYGKNLNAPGSIASLLN